MKAIVTGAKGMLGADLVEELKNSNFEVIALDYSDFDITNKNDMKKLILEKPGVVINCAAYTNVDLAETEKEKCALINIEGVKNLTLACKECNSILVQISTDYVFDGTKESYNEIDVKNPINYYGETKSKGEDFIISNLKNYYIVRTSWLFGKNGKNFVDTISKLAKEKQELKVVDDQKGKPTFTKDLSEALIKLISTKMPFGVYHITNSGICSWFEFAKKIIEINKSTCIIKPCTTLDFPRPAKRPKFSVLNNNKFNLLRSWESALKEYLGLIE